MNRCMEVGVYKCSVCEVVTGNYHYRAGCVGRKFRRQYSCNVKIELLRRTSVDSSIRSVYDGSCVTRHFADTERSIPSECVRTSASDNWRSVDNYTCI